jgi:quercetin dioxygenase-like cupin family protein
MEGVNRSGYELELHLTELAPGSEPHPPHRHEHEEIVMLQRGLVDVTIDGKTTRLTPGSVVYVASNEFHGWRNVGTEPSVYFIIALKFVPF